jgi:hypothetical protein
MALTNFPYGISSFGVPVLGGGVPLPSTSVGRFIFVDATYGVDGNDGVSWETAVKTIAQAYSMATSNRGDVIVLSGNATHALTAQLDVAKNRITFIGLGGGRSITQSAKINLATANLADDISATVLNEGVRNSFMNLKITNDGTHANSIAAMIDQGEGTLMQSCTIAKYSDLATATVADFICRADSPTYIDCEFGFDTLTQTVARPTFWLKAAAESSGALKAKNLRVKNCRFVAQNTQTTKVHILADTGYSAAFTNLFEDCTFLNPIMQSSSAVKPAVSVQANGGGDWLLMFTRPVCSSTDFCTSAVGNVGVLNVAAVSVAAATEGIQPTA